jgi:hypothetical protein
MPMPAISFKEFKKGRKMPDKPYLFEWFKYFGIKRYPINFKEFKQKE